MPSHAPLKLTIADHGTELTIEAVRENSIWEQCGAFAIVLAILCLFWEGGNQQAQIFAIVGSFLLVAGYLRMRTARNTVTLHATADELRSEGRSAETLVCSEVMLMQYDPGDEDDPSGLYVFVPERYVCLLPRLNPEQTARVLAALERKFPGLTQNRTPTGALDDDSRGMMNLWLSQPPRDGSDEEHTN
jgi:hypothetical protein